MGEARGGHERGQRESSSRRTAAREEQGETVAGYQPRHWPEPNSRLRPGQSSQLATSSGAWCHSGGPLVGATSDGKVGAPSWLTMDWRAGATPEADAGPPYGMTGPI